MSEPSGEQAVSLTPDFSIQQPTPEWVEERQEEEHLSIWPTVLAGGLTIALFGLVTGTLAFEVLGIVLAIGGVVGWVGDLRDEP